MPTKLRCTKLSENRKIRYGAKEFPYPVQQTFTATPVSRYVQVSDQREKYSATAIPRGSVLGTLNDPLPAGSAGSGGDGVGKKYNADETVERTKLSADMIEQILDAILKLDAMQWAVERMKKESSASGKGGGEVGSKEGAPQRAKYQADPIRAHKGAPAEPKFNTVTDAIDDYFDRAPSQPQQDLTYASGGSIEIADAPKTNTREHYQKRQAAHVNRCVAFDQEAAGREQIANRAMQHALATGSTYEEALHACGSSLPTSLPVSTIV